MPKLLYGFHFISLLDARVIPLILKLLLEPPKFYLSCKKDPFIPLRVLLSLR